MKWSSKTYRLIATHIHARLVVADEVEARNTLRRLAVDFAWTFEGDSERFDVAQFLAACGVE
jgi:hypothetical protein